jgi:hypothetical protein
MHYNNYAVKCICGGGGGGVMLELVMRKWKGLLEALHLAPVEAA